MKKWMMSFAMLVCAVAMNAQGWPANYGGVMLQGFFWDSFRVADGKTNETMATMYGAGWGENDQWYVPVTTWAELLNQKDNIAPYIDLIWLPQSGATVAPDKTTFTKEESATRAGHNGSTVTTYYDDEINNPDCMGFVPIFWLDHGMGKTYTVNGTTWSPKSYFGTQDELIALISAYKAAGTGAVEDVVINHKGGLSTWSGVQYATDFVDESVTGPTTGKTYSVDWTLADICSDDECGTGTGNADCGGHGEWARDIDQDAAHVQGNVVTYLSYLKNELGYVGFRYDYAKGFETKHFAQYNTAVRPTFSVGENWDSSDNIMTWIKQTQGEGNFQSAAFDFPLQEVIRTSFNDESCQSFRNLESAGFIWNNQFKRYAVTFIDNHDTFKDLPTDASNSGYQHRLNHQIVEANCFILSMPGTPCLFYPHFMHSDWHDIIVKFIKARRTAGVNNMSTINASVQTGNYGIAWRVTGDNGELYLQLGSESVATGVPDGFTQVWCNDASTCRLSITSSLADAIDSNEKQNLLYGYPVVSLASGNYTADVTTTVKPSCEGTTLVYTLNGQTPTKASKQITDTAGISLTINETTTLKVGVLTSDGEVQNVVTRTYAIDKNTSSNTIKVYVKYDDGDETPYLYAWNDNGTLTDAFPGWAYSTDNKVVVGGVTWLHATLSASEANLIFSRGSDDTKTADITGVTTDVFYTFSDNVAYDLTTTYTAALYDPQVSIDLASGSYSSTISPKLTASNSGATIVYTTDGSAPTADSPQFTYEGTVTFSSTGNHILRAGILYNGEVINQVARTYYVGYQVPTSGITIYVKKYEDFGAPTMYYDSAATRIGVPKDTKRPSHSMVPTTTATINGTEWYTMHFDDREYMRLCFTYSDVYSFTFYIYHPGIYFYDYHTPYSSTDVTKRCTDVTDSLVTYTSNGTTVSVGTYVSRLMYPIGDILPDSVTAKAGKSSTYWYLRSGVPTKTVKTTNGVEMYYIDYETTNYGRSKDYIQFWSKNSSNKTTSSNIESYVGDHYYTLAIAKQGYVTPTECDLGTYILDCTWSLKAVEQKEEPADEDEGVTIYVQSSWNPYLYAWNGDTKYNGEWGTANMLSETEEVGGVTWYKWTTTATNFTMILHNNDGSQTGNISITKAGKYFYQYNLSDGNPGATTYNDVTSQYLETGTVNVYVSAETAPYLYAWNGSTTYNGAWPGTQMSDKSHEHNNINWYGFSQSTSSLNIIFNNGKSDTEKKQTADITGLTPGDYYFTYNGETGYTLVDGVLPSCATYQSDAKYYFFFENDQPYGSPYAWVYNGTTSYSGSSWPGEALVVPVGVAANGNIIYKWTYSGDNATAPAYVMFNDNGGNVVGTSQTPAYTFVNGGYYNCNGLAGKVNDNLLTLSELLRSGEVGKSYVIANDLTGIYLNADGNYLWVKDGDGESITPSYQTTQSTYSGVSRYQDGDYDQSNWAQLIIKDVDQDDSEKYTNKTLLGQTVLGTLVDKVNPTIELQANPVVGDDAEAYVANTYIPANFVEQNEFYFVEPKTQEYAKLDWAVVTNVSDDGKTATLVVPATEEAINGYGISGAVKVYLVDGYWSGDGVLSASTIINNGLVIVKTLSEENAAPMRRISGSDSEPTGAKGVYLLGGEISPLGEFTEISDLTQTGATVVSIRYYDLNGRVSATPHQGVNIVEIRYDDGSRDVKKVLK